MPRHSDKKEPVAPETLPYRPCVGIMLINREGLVWVGNRIQEVDTGSTLTWQMPQGGIDEGESPEEAARRELMEETGTDKAQIVGETKDWLTYELPPHLVGIALKGKYRGQKQKWFAMRFTGEDSDIDIAADDHQEFSEWTWVPIEELLELIVPFKRSVYERLVREFAPFAVPQEG
ncbi:NUDIX hydrolase [Parvibaculum lavamentivorans DS-1]|uniref:RNA pyrophosphohydrolase n=1 Tax=Parvibaculum lavamentivorans (strain DS-1 / DSM 13023 / NCIMB 13966) TaxID=402881 RepID=A7HT57_PARL1|nr:RNA pyrophosphohydrolase [Parvibaculum lavamentivorans]ABS63090.1 NUDIX hydrolase [Parvibaculum lavamentivorans DS-1]